jgi:hypothetical protein
MTIRIIKQPKNNFGISWCLINNHPFHGSWVNIFLFKICIDIRFGKDIEE